MHARRQWHVKVALAGIEVRPYMRVLFPALPVLLSMRRMVADADSATNTEPVLSTHRPAGLLRPVARTRGVAACATHEHDTHTQSGNMLTWCRCEWLPWLSAFMHCVHGVRDRSGKHSPSLDTSCISHICEYPSLIRIRLGVWGSCVHALGTRTHPYTGAERTRLLVHDSKGDVLA